MIETDYKPWGVGRWCVVGGVLLALHVVLLRNLGHPMMNGPALDIPASQLVLFPPHSTDLNEEWIPNPASYALPDKDGFSGSALRMVPRTVLPPLSRESNPVFLVSSSETPLGPLPDIRSPVSGGFVTNRPAKLAVVLPTVVGNQTTIIYATAIKGRAPEKPVSFPSWQGDGLPSPTRVELAINPLGEVKLVRLVESSKSKAMDALALATVGSMHFRPLPGAEVSGANDTKLYSWGMLGVFWAPAPPETR